MYIFFGCAALLLSSCGSLIGQRAQSQCNNEFVRQSVVDKTKDMLSSRFKPATIDVTLGKAETIEVVNGEEKCQTELTIKATQINYKARSVAEIGE